MRKLVAACSAALLAGAVLAACGSSSKPESGGGTNNNSTSAGNSNGSGSSDFSALLSDIGKQKFKVTWTDSGDNEQTYAQDGQGNTVTIDGDNQVYGTPNATISCSKSGDQWTCTQTSITLGSNSGYVALSAAEKNYATALADKFGNTSTKTIAGRSADCFTITAKDFGVGSAVAGALGASLKGALSYCNDHETGALLENTITDEDGQTSTQFLVTKFEQPSASDFQPPATPTVVTIPTITMPGGVGAQ